MLRKRFFLTKEEDVILLPLRQKPSDSQFIAPDPDGHLSTKLTNSVHDCVWSEIVRWFDGNVYWSENNDCGAARLLNRFSCTRRGQSLR